MSDSDAPVKAEREVRHWRGGQEFASPDCLAEEVAVALVYNGISHAVMMVTPADLEDFALGFSLTEGIIDRPDQMYDVQVVRQPLGMEVQIELASECMMGLKQRRRQLTGRTGCGLCGAESLEMAMSGVAADLTVPAQAEVSHEAVQRALDQLGSRQPLQELTGAVHGAAWCNLDGNIQLLREDVGRHNALDKLIGARLAQGDLSPGFALVSSRASYEMVNKTARAGISMLVAVSAATRLAVDVAEQTGITLVGFGRPGRHLVYSHAQRLKD
jgi:FdhD protein